MLVSIVVPEKLPGQKRWRRSRRRRRWRRRRTWIFGRFWRLFTVTPTYYLQLFWYLCVHSVEDSTLILIFDPLFLYFSRGRQNSALIAIHKISAGSISFFKILGYAATASSNSTVHWTDCGALQSSVDASHYSRLSCRDTQLLQHAAINRLSITDCCKTKRRQRIDLKLEKKLWKPVYKVIWQQATSPTCHPWRFPMDSSDLDPI